MGITENKDTMQRGPKQKRAQFLLSPSPSPPGPQRTVRGAEAHLPATGQGIAHRQTCLTTGSTFQRLPIPNAFKSMQQDIPVFLNHFTQTYTHSMKKECYQRAKHYKNQRFTSSNCDETPLLHILWGEGQPHPETPKWRCVETHGDSWLSYPHESLGSGFF